VNTTTGKIATIMDKIIPFFREDKSHQKEDEKLLPRKQLLLKKRQFSAYMYAGFHKGKMY
jgi:hypothetical protein